ADNVTRIAWASRGNISLTDLSLPKSLARSGATACSAIRCCAGRAGLCSFRTQTDDAFTQESRVGRERLVESLVRFFIPPGEQGIVTIVERVPIAQGIS